MVAVSCLVVTPFVSRGSLWLTGPLLVVALLAGAYPARRVIFGEQWGLAAYLRFSIFSGIGMIGFWVMLALTPSVIAGIASVDARFGGLAAAVIATLLIICQMNYPRFWVAAHRATALDREDLAPLFEAIVKRARCPAPVLYRFGAPGAYIMNALALPHAKRPAVAFGDSLLEQLEPKEIAAVFAHEVAHLEHFDAARLRRLGLVSLVLIAMATALMAILVAITPEHGGWLSLGILITILGTLGMMSSRSQANETASDLRAVELTGDADALISALTRLHAGLRLPRQWAHEMEKSVSHPSLARRVQAIRERASVKLPALDRATIARTPSGGSRIALDDSRAYFFEGLAAETPDDLPAMREQSSSYRALAYTEITELRLIATANGRALKARDLTGKSWIVALRADDVPAVDRALAVVDARLGKRRKEKSSANAQLLAIASLAAMFAAGQLGVVLVPILVALIRPSAAALAALGAMAVGRAVAAMAMGEMSTQPVSVVGLGALAVLGATAMWLAWRDSRAMRDARQSGEARSILGALAAAATIVIALLLLSSAGASPSVLLASPLVAALAMLGVGAGAALIPDDIRARRRAGGALAAVAGMLVLIHARQTLVLRGPSLAIVEAAAERVTDVALESGAYRLELAPGGRHYAVQGVVGSNHGYADEDDVSFRWTIGEIGGASRMVDALDVAFIDDDVVLILGWHEDSIVVRTDSVGPRHAGPFWRRTLPSLIGPQLIVDPAARRWTVTGGLETGELVAFSGAQGDARDFLERRWPPDTVWMQPLHVRPDGSLISYSLTTPRDRLRSAVSMLAGPSMRFDVWRSGDGRRVRVGTMDGVPHCQVSSNTMTCAGRGAGRAQVWRMTTGETGRPLGVLPPGYDVRNVGIAGPIVAIEQMGTAIIVVDPDTRSGRRFHLEGAPSSGTGIVLDARAMGDVIATLEVHTGETRIGVYRVR